MKFYCEWEEEVKCIRQNMAYVEAESEEEAHEKILSGTDIDCIDSCDVKDIDNKIINISVIENEDLL